MDSERRGVGTIAIGEDHLALAEAVRRFVAEQIPPAAVRAAIDAPDTLPPFFDQLQKLGWLGLHVSEARGGEGFGMAEAAIVAEELGRAAAPGPWLSAMWAAAVAGIDGSSLGALAIGSPLEAEEVDGRVTVSGRTGPMLTVGLATAEVGD